MVLVHLEGVQAHTGNMHQQKSRNTIYIPLLLLCSLTINFVFNALGTVFMICAQQMTHMLGCQTTITITRTLTNPSPEPSLPSHYHQSFSCIGRYRNAPWLPLAYEAAHRDGSTSPHSPSWLCISPGRYPSSQCNGAGSRTGRIGATPVILNIDSWPIIIIIITLPQERSRVLLL